MKREFKVGDKVVCKHPVVVCDDFTDKVGVVVDISPRPDMDTGEQVIIINYGDCDQTAYVDIDGVELVESPIVEVGEETPNMELPEVGSKWVAKVRHPEGAGVEKGDCVTVYRIEGSGTICYSLEGYSWVASPDEWFNSFEQQKTSTESTAEVTEGYDLSEYTTGKVASDGGPSAYYDFPEGCSTLNDLIEYKNMSFAQGNIFKAAYRLGNKEGISLEYDLKKIKYYADRMLNQIGKE